MVRNIYDVWGDNSTSTAAAAAEFSQLTTAVEPITRADDFGQNSVHPISSLISATNLTYDSEKKKSKNYKTCASNH